MSPFYTRKPHKAGLFLYGFHKSGEESRMAVVAPYTEGRFGEQDKYYGLAKGSIDNDEKPLISAIRETWEETGIDLEKFLGAENIARLEKGEKLRDITHPEFPGVTILKFDPHPVQHGYKWHGFRPNDLSLFGVEIEGIDHLRPFLKNRENGNGLGRVGKTVADRVSDPDLYPTRQQLVQWLETGVMPRAKWNEGRPESRLSLNTGGDYAEWFASMKRRTGKHDFKAPREILQAIIGGPQVATTGERPENWERFNESVQRRNGNDEANFRNALREIKHELKACNVLHGDLDEIKLDEKDCPLAYYQEGADILDASDFLTFSIERMRANKHYAMAFGGARRDQKYTQPRDYLQHSQLIACAPFLQDRDIEEAEQRLEKGIRQNAHPYYRANRLPDAPPLELTDKMARYRDRHEASWGKREKQREGTRSVAAVALS